MQTYRAWNPLARLGARVIGVRPVSAQATIARKATQSRTPFRKSEAGHFEKHHASLESGESGLSMLEIIVVMAIASILVAIAAPAWISFHNTQQLNAAQDEVYQALRQAQFEAKRRNLRWQVSFRNVEGQGQYALHPVTLPPTLADWTELPDGVQLDLRRTTLRPQSGVYRLQFNHQGHVNGQLGRVSLMGKARMRTRRSILASTLIGSVRKAND